MNFDVYRIVKASILIYRQNQYNLKLYPVMDIID
jgi:hypothetical protein